MPRTRTKPATKKLVSMRYLVFIRRTTTGYSADLPDLPGCVAAAKTLKGTHKLIAEAVLLHLDLMHQSGESIPAPRKSIEFAVDDEAMEEYCTWVDVLVPMPIATAAGV